MQEELIEIVDEAGNLIEGVTVEWVLETYGKQKGAAYIFQYGKERAKKIAFLYGDNIRKQIIGSVSELRRAAWPTKGRIAASYLKTKATQQKLEAVKENFPEDTALIDALIDAFDNPYLEAEVSTINVEVVARGEEETVKQLAEIHIAKSVALLSVDNEIEGITHRAAEAIDATTTEEELKAVTEAFIVEANSKRDQILSVINS